MIHNPMIQAVAPGMPAAGYPAQQSSSAPAGPGAFQEAMVLHQAPSSSSHQLLAAASTANQQNQSQTALRVNPPSMNTTTTT